MKPLDIRQKMDHRDSMNLADRLIALILDMPVEEQKELLEIVEEKDLNKKRRYERKSCKNHVSFTSQNRVYGGELRDFNDFGAFIEAKESPAVGQMISMIFQVPESRDQIRISGKIVRVLKNGFGVKFDVMIQALLKKYIKRPDKGNDN